MKVKRNFAHIFCTRGLPQRLDYWWRVAVRAAVDTSSDTVAYHVRRRALSSSETVIPVNSTARPHIEAGVDALATAYPAATVVLAAIGSNLYAEDRVEYFSVFLVAAQEMCQWHRGTMTGCRPVGKGARRRSQKGRNCERWHPSHPQAAVCNWHYYYNYYTWLWLCSGAAASTVLLVGIVSAVVISVALPPGWDAASRSALELVIVTACRTHTLLNSILFYFILLGAKSTNQSIFVYYGMTKWRPTTRSITWHTDSRYYSCYFFKPR